MVHCGIMLIGRGRTTFTTQLIAENNTVNGKPVYYYTNQDMEGISVPSDAGQVILGNVTGLTIEGVNVSGGSVGIFLGYSSHITIANSIITDNTKEGIYLTFSSGNTIVNNHISDNMDGIRLRYSSNTTITDNLITNNDEDGISLQESSSNTTIVDNTITNNGKDGIRVNFFSPLLSLAPHNTTLNLCPRVYIPPSKNNTIANNTLTDNSYAGIDLYHSSGNTIQSNRITNCTSGMYLKGASETLIGDNTITHNTDAGIFLYISSNMTITGNTIANNRKGILLKSHSTSNLVYRNNFIENVVHANDTHGGNAFNKSTIGNYWEDYNGTDANGDGIGDTPYEIPGGAGSKDYHPAMTPFALSPSPTSWWQYVLRFFIPIVMLAVGSVFGLLLVRYLGDPFRPHSFMRYTRLKTVIMTVTAFLQRVLKNQDQKIPSIQSAVETTVDELGTRLEGTLREEDKPDLINLVREAFYLLGNRFGLTWKDAWTVGEYMSALIERAGPAYTSLLGEGYNHYEKILYAERAEWREALQAIHHILVKLTQKMRTLPPPHFRRKRG